MFGEDAEEILASSDKWLTKTRHGLEISSDHVVVATGLDRVPQWPSYEGEDGLPHQVIGDGPSRGLSFVGFDNHRPGGVLGTVFEESETVVDRIRGT